MRTYIAHYPHHQHKFLVASFDDTHQLTTITTITNLEDIITISPLPHTVKPFRTLINMISNNSNVPLEMEENV